MAKGGTKLVRDVACPFCALACDDLVIEQTAERSLAVRENGCDLSRRSFARVAGAAPPQVDGKPVTLDNAVARAAQLLGRSRAPLIAGMAADVAGIRAALRLAEKIGAVVDDLGSDGLFRNLRVLQDSGWVTTTLGEVRNRADVMLIVGPDPAQSLPRFYERCLPAAETLFGRPKGPPQLFRLGAAESPAQKPPSGPQATQVPCDDAQLPAALAALRALINGRPIAPGNAANLPLASLQEIAAALQKAAYGVVAWNAAMLEAGSAELTVQVLAELVRDLNQTTRCSGLPLAGGDNLIGANQTCTWQYGLPLRTSFAGGAPVHDPLLNSARRKIAAAETDAVVWISAFRDQPPTRLPANSIALVPPGTKFDRAPAVQIPVGTPGIDHAGQMFRMDNLVALPLRGLLQRDLPSAADVLNRIAKALTKELAPA
jgi:formylmethanofuran dehydrogenase subunit B